MAQQQTGSSNAAWVEFYNSPAARAWADHHAPIDRFFGGLTRAALDIAAPQVGERVLDIGCGAGTTVLELAARVGPGGHVLGADISERSVARAQERIAAAGLRHAEVILADVSAHAFAPNSFDLAFSRFGVMFFADPTTAFANVRWAMKPGGRLALAVFRTAAENPWTVSPLAAVQHMLPPQAAAEELPMFTWADPGRVRRILEGAGFQHVAMTPLDPAMQFAGPDGAREAAELAMMIGTLPRTMLGISAQQREAVQAALEAFFRGHDGPSGIVLPGALWVMQARA